VLLDFAGQSQLKLPFVKTANTLPEVRVIRTEFSLSEACKVCPVFASPPNGRAKKQKKAGSDSATLYGRQPLTKVEWTDAIIDRFQSQWANDELVYCATFEDLEKAASYFRMLYFELTSAAVGFCVSLGAAWPLQRQLHVHRPCAG
jgi:hypothetical protein